jgi:hypothetical protein
MDWPRAITPAKIRPTTSIARMMERPSSAAVFAASGSIGAMLTDAARVQLEGLRNFGPGRPAGPCLAALAEG